MDVHHTTVNVGYGPADAGGSSRDGAASVDTPGDRHGVRDVDAEVADCAIHLRMAQQKLNSAQVPGLPGVPRHLGPSHGMRSAGARSQAVQRDPSPDDPRRLSCRQVRAAGNTAGPRELEGDHLWVGSTAFEGQPRRPGDLEPDRLSGPALDHQGARLHPPPPQSHHPAADNVATAQLAVDGHSEQREIRRVAGQLEPGPDGTDVPRWERESLTCVAALVSGDADRMQGREQIKGHGNTSCPPASPFFGHTDTDRMPHPGPRRGRRAETGHLGTKNRPARGGPECRAALQGGRPPDAQRSSRAASPYAASQSTRAKVPPPIWTQSLPTDAARNASAVPRPSSACGWFGSTSAFISTR